MKPSASNIVAFLASSLPLLSTIADAFVYPSTPVTETVWRPNSNAVISWTDDKTYPSLALNPIFDIFLMTGADDHQVKLETIATNVRGAVTRTINYKVPYVSPPGRIYFLMFQTKDLNSTAWATRFTITDADGDEGNLKPVMPAGGKVNPGGVGSIVSPEVAKKEAKETKEAKKHRGKDKGKDNDDENDEKDSKQAHEDAGSPNGNSRSEVSSSPGSSTSGSDSSSSSASPSPAESKSSSSSSSSSSSTENHASHGSPAGSPLGSSAPGVTVKTPIANGGNSKPALVDVGARVNKGKPAGAHSAGSTTTAAASSMAMAAFVAFAVLIGF
ncbi:hypothetical protein BGZ49_002358 [Haplosporangium sp. Z 27]|nr:hypothetical protein BGZ49_002358 [Haplosporangium sp. Z 27]